MVVLDLVDWLKGPDVEPKARLIVLDAGESGEMATGKGEETKPKFEILVQLPNGEKRLWTMNMTSQRAVAGIYGKDTAKWVGKPIDVFTQDQNVRGTPRSVVYARVPAQPAAPSQGDKVL